MRLALWCVLQRPKTFSLQTPAGSAAKGLPRDTGAPHLTFRSAASGTLAERCKRHAEPRSLKSMQ